MTLNCWVDGSYNNFKVGIGVLVKRNDTVIFQLAMSENMGSTNNVAEYRAFNSCLMWLLRKNYQQKKIVVHSDSRMLVGQVNREMKLRNGSYLKEAEKALRLVDNFSNLSVIWIPRTQNQEADTLSKL